MSDVHDRPAGDHPDAELRALQARAYGRDADIADDPVALARLRELEAAVAAQARLTADARRESAIDAPAPSIADTLPSEEDRPAVRMRPELPTLADPALAHPALADPALTGLPPDAPARPTRSRRVVFGWIASLAAVAVVVAIASSAITAGMSRSVDQPENSQHVATLHVDPDFQTPYSFNDTPVDLTGFEEFQGLTVMSGRRWLNGTDAPCLLVASTDGLYGNPNLGGSTAYGCSAGKFPATALLSVDSDAPASLRAMFPDGTGLQFVLGSKRIEVYADRAPTAQPTSTTSRRVPHPSPTPLAIPDHLEGELARGVFLKGSRDSPAASSVVSAAPKKGVEYSLEGACTSNKRGVVMQYELRTTDPKPTTLEGGSVTCDGTLTSITGALVTDRPPQVVFTATDGVLEGYAIVVPSRTG